MLAQGFLDLFFDAAQIFELSTKAAFAKAALDTLRINGRVLRQSWCSASPKLSRKIPSFFPRTILDIFSRVDIQTGSSGIHR